MAIGHTKTLILDNLHYRLWTAAWRASGLAIRLIILFGYDGLKGTRKISPSYTNDTYLICTRLGPRISSVKDKGPSYGGQQELAPAQ